MVPTHVFWEGLYTYFLLCVWKLLSALCGSPETAMGYWQHCCPSVFLCRKSFSSGRIAGTRCQLAVERNLETGGVMVYQEDWTLPSCYPVNQSWLYVAVVATWLAVQFPSLFSNLSGSGHERDSRMLSDKPVLMIAEYELTSTRTSLQQN